MGHISIESNLWKLRSELGVYEREQLPFATASALNALAKKVQDAEVAALKATLKNPSPFTQNSVKVAKARKTNLMAKVFVMDKASQYLDPYEFGGVHKLNSKALLNPKDITLNQYGQMSKRTLATLRSRPDVFIGPVKTAKGVINGVWQRVTDPDRVTLLNAKGKRLRGLNKATVGADGKAQGHLKLLVRFGDALPVHQKWNYMSRAKAIVESNFEKEFKIAMDKAMATAK